MLLNRGDRTASKKPPCSDGDEDEDDEEEEEVADSLIVYLADNRAPISVFYLPIRYLEEFRRPDKPLSGR